MAGLYHHSPIRLHDVDNFILRASFTVAWITLYSATVFNKNFYDTEMSLCIQLAGFLDRK